MFLKSLEKTRLVYSERLLYPLEGNELTLSHDLSTDSRQNVRDDVKYVMRTGKNVTSGPYSLRQGGLGLVIRMPIFRNESYWGLVNVVLDFDAVIEKSAIAEKYEGISMTMINSDGYAFWHSNTTNEVVMPMYTSEIDLIGGKIQILGTISDEIDKEYRLKLLSFILLSLLLVLILIVLILNNLNKNIILSEQVKKMIYYDQLTELPNRRYLVDFLDILIKKKTNFAVAFMDIDDFKMINDTLGHTFGDEILGLISKRLEKHATDKTKVFRWGGDEFIIISSDYEHIQVFIRLVKHIKIELELAYKVGKEIYDITVSFGVSEYPTNGMSSDEIIKNADIALYYAKSSGKSMIRSYTNQIGDTATERFELERRLRYAVEIEEIEVYFQPILSMDENKIVGTEALLRWQKGDTYISPEIFIPLAEKNNLMGVINRMIIGKIEALFVQLNIRKNEFRIHMNIAATDFNENLLVELRSLNKRQEGILNHMVIEIVEGSAISNFRQAQYITSELQALGIEVALDDFGKGYSSLSYLILLGINTLKIDKSFILKLVENSIEYKLVKAIINLADELDINIVAEGVETIGQQAILKKLKCEMYQGFLYSKAIPIEAFLELYQNDQSL